MRDIAIIAVVILISVAGFVFIPAKEPQCVGVTERLFLGCRR